MKSDKRVIVRKKTTVANFGDILQSSRLRMFKAKMLFKVAVHCVCFVLSLIKCFQRQYRNRMQDKSRVEIQDEIEHHIFIALNSYSSSGVLPFIKPTTDTTLDLQRILAIAPSLRGIIEENLLMKYLKRIRFIQEFPLDTQLQLFNVLYFESYEPGRVINKEGYASDAAYFIWHGSVIVNNRVKDIRNGSMFNLTVNVLKAGESFGVKEVLNGIKHEHSVISRTPIVLLSIDKKNFNAILGADLSERAHEAVLYACSLHHFNMFPMLPFTINPRVVFTSYYRFNSVVTVYSEHNITSMVVVVRQGGCKVVIKQSSPPSHDIFVNRSKPFLPPVTKRRFCNKVKPPSGRAESFYQISTIEAGECFGLQFLFNKPSCFLAIISRGAECILINREFFLQEVSKEMRKSMSTPSGYYPEKHILDFAICQKRQWTKFKKDLVKELVFKKL